MSIYLEAVSRFLLTGHAAKEPPTGKSLKIVVFEVWPTRKALAESSGQIVISHRRSFLEPRYDCFGLFVVCFWFEVMFFTDSYIWKWSTAPQRCGTEAFLFSSLQQMVWDWWGFSQIRQSFVSGSRLRGRVLQNFDPLRKIHEPAPGEQSP